MAEFVGLAASIATLSKVVKLLVETVQSFEAGPNELKMVCEECQQLIEQIEALHLIQQRLTFKSQSAPLNYKLQAQLNGVELARTSLQRLQRKLSRIASRNKGRTGIKWTFGDRQKAKNLLNDLLMTRTALNTTLCLGFSLHYESDNGHSECQASIKAMETEMKRLKNCIAFNLSNTEPPRQVMTHPQRALSNQGFDSWSMAICTPFFGTEVLRLLLTKSYDSKTLYSLSLLLALPFQQGLSVNLLASVSMADFQLKECSLSILPIVDENSRFMQACLNGDVSEIRHWLQTRQVSPKMLDTNHQSPLARTIESGNLQAVSTLIHAGAEVNGLFGKRRTSPLAWAVQCQKLEIARLLIAHGACCQHISAYGYTPIFYHYSGTSRPTATPQDFLTLFAACADFTFSHDIIDRAGFGLIHLATIFGSPTDLSRLLAFGVDPCALNGHLKWTAIQNAIYHDRYDNFKVLLPYQSINIVDVRGWTLLHISVSKGRDNFTRHLLQLGVMTSLRTIPYYSDMKKSLHGGCWTPAEVALAYGRRKYILYVNALRDILGDDLQADEVFVDAQEQL